MKSLDEGSGIEISSDRAFILHLRGLNKVSRGVVKMEWKISRFYLKKQFEL
jgi:hypothetical protein